MNDLIVGLAGKSRLKRAGTSRAMVAFAWGDTPVCEDVTSIVPEQPWGLLQTTQGAAHRTEGVERIIRAKRLPSDKRGEDREIFVGAENGVVEVVHDEDPLLCRYVDLAASVVRYKGVAYYATSEGIAFPTVYVNEAKARIAAGETTLTVGKVIAEHLGGDHADPHSTLTNGRLKREDILYRVIFAAFVQIDLTPVG